jgi:tetratricopeptide (TPR) repeat protein
MSDWQEAERRIERAHDLYERGKWEEALVELKRAIEINPHMGAWYFNLGLTLDMMERHEEALAAYRSALEIDGQDIESLAAAGTDCNRLERYREAIEYFQRVESLDPQYESSYCNRIVAYTELGEHDHAEEMFYIARQYKEKCPACLYNIGMSLFARGRYDRALWCWQQVLEIDADYPQVHARIADVFWAKNQHAEARRHLMEELRSDPGNIDTLLDLGELLMEMGHNGLAAEKFRQVLDLDPEDSTAHYQLGVLAQLEGDDRLAMDRFKFVLRHDAQFVGAHLRMAQIYHRAKNRAEALYHANCELAQAEIDDQTLLELGGLLIDMGQLEAAKLAMRRVLQDSDTNADAHHGLAVACLMSGDLDTGIDECKKTLKLQPKHALAMSNLAMAYLNRREYARARYWLDEAMDIAPEDHHLRQIANRVRYESLAYNLRHFPANVLRWLHRKLK